ncbi:MAG: xanthine dehydrogenase family protein subunit M [Thermodesulfobacteriota bacterium]
MASFTYVKHKDLTGLLPDLAEAGEKGAVLAGGTDLLLGIKAGRKKPEVVFDVSEIAEMQDIRDEGPLLRIGAGVRMADLAVAKPVIAEAGFLAQAASLMGSPQIRNKATIGGNINTASPAGDTIAPLWAAGARVRLSGLGRVREADLEDYILGPGRVDLKPGEILTDILIPKPKPGRRTHFLKTGRRKALFISIVNAAGWMEFDAEGAVGDLRLVLGAVAPTPLRVTEAEDFIRGRKPEPKLLAEAAAKAAGQCRPITDIRGTAEGRRLLAEAWTLRLLEILTETAKGRG